MNTNHSRDALADDELYESIVAHREKFNIVRGIDYANHGKDKINFIPPSAIMKEWKKDYQTMQESMIYSDTKSFEELIKKLEELRERLIV